MLSNLHNPKGNNADKKKIALQKKKLHRTDSGAFCTDKEKKKKKKAKSIKDTNNTKEEA
jgi:hypothetical protein